MAKIAVKSEWMAGHLTQEQCGRSPQNRTLASAGGWSVSDVICNAGPGDRTFEEKHSNVCIAMVTKGTFQYRSNLGREMMTPGSLLLGNAGQHFECGHEHGVGDHCLSFAFDPGYFEDLVAETGVKNLHVCFPVLRIPPMRELSPLIARAHVHWIKADGEIPTGARHKSATKSEILATNPLASDQGFPTGTAMWEEIGTELAMRALELAGDCIPNQGSSLATEARVTRIVRMIESRPDQDYKLCMLAREAKLSRYHFLRVFQQLTGLTPHRYILRTRLKYAATQLALKQSSILNVALSSGFGDVSNFNHAFRAEFGINPSSFQKGTWRNPSRRSLSPCRSRLPI